MSIFRTVAALAIRFSWSMPGRRMSVRFRWGLVGSARAKGATIRSIATFQRKTDLCILVDKTSPMEKVADLRGKSVVVFAASPWAPLHRRLSEIRRTDRDDLKVEVVDPAALWGTYIAKRSDGLMSTVSSALPLAEATAPVEVSVGVGCGHCVSRATAWSHATEMIASKGPALKRLIEVQQRAWQHLRTNPEDGVEGDDRRAPGRQAGPRGAARTDQADAGLLQYVGVAGQADRLAGTGGLGSGVASRWRRPLCVNAGAGRPTTTTPTASSSNEPAPAGLALHQSTAHVCAAPRGQDLRLPARAGARRWTTSTSTSAPASSSASSARPAAASSTLLKLVAGLEGRDHRHDRRSAASRSTARRTAWASCSSATCCWTGAPSSTMC